MRKFQILLILLQLPKVVTLALVLVEIPPSKIPAAVKINPTNMVRPVNACMPSMNVCAIPAYDKMRPANPMACKAHSWHH